MALKMVKGSIDRMFDKNLQDLVRGIRNHKEDEVSPALPATRPPARSQPRPPRPGRRAPEARRRPQRAPELRLSHPAPASSGLSGAVPLVASRRSLHSPTVPRGPPPPPCG